MSAMIELRHVGKSFENKSGEIVKAVGDVSLTVEKGEFVCIVGPSGCGKSTILNMIAGFMPPTGGEVYVDGARVDRDVPASLGYIFQKDTVLPWYTVRQNVGLGLKFAGAARPDTNKKIDRLLRLAHLSNFSEAYPHQLSGGMRRRVALCMSLAVDPKILLLDEPFGALDTHTKTHLHSELLEIWRELGQTIVMITHDLDEAVTLASRVIVLSTPPSRILLEEVIDIPYPRDVFELRQSSQFTSHSQRVWKVLGNQFRAAA
ncbi:ABC transporter ATP-binding protein [Bradyrhizobium symbiodeficiens]|uniref:ABC transporter ATP-binding protein n=1 Tax=Bradyrhizobium symbiodeficiens TaxID=1404367 RepID=UPI000BA1AED6|nr:ABC transporter ATP-binding protein [Bradyrhizobium symbiodeficiens]AWM09906.1 ABC transporter ATP-binding protein [Bradyrhizobium symbiodeficiens]